MATATRGKQQKDLVEAVAKLPIDHPLHARK
jgi:hypothetical protein